MSSNEKISNEIMAVIAASVASLESRPGHRLEVKSIRRIPQNSPVWNTTGRYERLARNLNSM